MLASRTSRCALRAGLGLALLSSFALAVGGNQPCVPDWRATFGGSAALDAEVRASAVFDDGTGPSLYVGGRFTTAGGIAVARVARWDGTSWSALGSGLSGGAQTAVNALCVHDDGSGPALYAGGDFTSAGGVAADRVARWNGTSWSALGAGLDGVCHVLAVVDSGTGPALHGGGAFANAGGGAAGRIARWDGAVWSGVGGAAVTAGSVHALANWDEGGDALYVGGSFASVGGVTASGIASWDGATWTALSSDLGTATVHALRVHSDNSGVGEALYVGGSFGNVANNVARWNGATWDAYGTGMDGPVRALTVVDFALYAAGDFTIADDVTARGIALWDGTDWYPVGGGTAGAASDRSRHSTTAAVPRSSPAAGSRRARPAMPTSRGGAASPAAATPSALAPRSTARAGTRASRAAAATSRRRRVVCISPSSRRRRFGTA